MKVKVKELEYYIDGNCIKILDVAKVIIRKDWDMLFCVDGNVGTGKSLFTMQMAKYVDEDFNLDCIAFNPKEFKKIVVNAKPYSAVVYDEAMTGLYSRGSMTLINRTLVSMLAEIRQKNLFVFIVLPSFFDLERPIAIFRARGLFHVYTGDNFERGYFCFFNIDKKKELYLEGKKFYSYRRPRANVYGRFTNFYVVDEQEYRKRKLDALRDREHGRDSNDIEKEIKEKLFEQVVNFDVENLKLTHEIKMQIIGISRGTYFKKLAALKEKKAEIEKYI